VGSLILTVLSSYFGKPAPTAFDILYIYFGELTNDEKTTITIENVNIDRSLKYLKPNSKSYFEKV
jgi:hypothetical protein